MRTAVTSARASGERRPYRDSPADAGAAGEADAADAAAQEPPALAALPPITDVAARFPTPSPLPSLAAAAAAAVTR